MKPDDPCGHAFPRRSPPNTRTLADVWRVLIDAACHKLQATLKCVSRRSERNHLTYRDNKIILLYTRGWALELCMAHVRGRLGERFRF
jgi:hypothetical protein